MYLKYVFSCHAIRNNPKKFHGRPDFRWLNTMATHHNILGIGHTGNHQHLLGIRLVTFHNEETNI